MDDAPTPSERPWILAEGTLASLPAPARVSAIADERVMAVSLRGELDTGASPRVARELLELLTGSVERVVLNLAELSFIDSAGLGVLNMVRVQALHSGVALRLQELSPAVERVLELSGMVRVFEIER